MQHSLKRLALALPACVLAFWGCVEQWQLQPGASCAVWMLICAAAVLAASLLKTARRVSIVSAALGLLLAAFMVVGSEIHTFETIERLLDLREMPKAVMRLLGLAILAASLLRLFCHCQ